jgi:competence protein ComEC
MKLVYLGGAWLVGLCLGLAPVAMPLWTYALAFSAVFLLVLLRRFKASILVSLCLALFAAGFWRSQSWAVQSPEESLSYFNDRGVVEVTGTIKGDPEVLDKGVRFTLEVERVSFEGTARTTSGKVLVYTSLLPPANASGEFPYYRYGDVLKLRGHLKTPTENETFSYREYLARQGIYSVISFPQRVAFLSSDNGFRALIWIYRLRISLAKNLQSLSPEPEASLSQGILLGMRATIPKALSEAFSRTGTIHILAISGQNLTIVAGLLVSFGIWLFGRRHRLYILLALATIWFYALLTGFVPTVVRAAIMATLFLMAEVLGRPGSAAPAIVFAAALMAGLKPATINDIGFQLSFLSILGLTYLAPKFHSSWKQLVEHRIEAHWWGNYIGAAVESFGVCLAAVLFTWPVVAYNFRWVSLFGIPATLLLLPVLPATILLSAATAFIGLALPAVAQVIAWGAWLPLFYMVAIVQLFNSLPAASVPINLSIWILPSYYAALTAGIWFFSNTSTHIEYIKSLALKLPVAKGVAISNRILSLSRKWIVAILLCLASLIWIAVLMAPDSRLHISFLELDGAQAVFIETPKGQTILIDGGANPEKLNSALGTKLPFYQRKIDMVILTSPEASHCTGLINVLRRYRVAQVVEPDVALVLPKRLPASYFEWRREVQKQNIPSTKGATGQWIDLGNRHKLEVVYPPQPSFPSAAVSLDDTKMILRLQAGEISFLLAANIGEDALTYLQTDRVNLKSTVLQTPSPDSTVLTSKSLLGTASPEIVVVPAVKDKSVADHDAILSQDNVSLCTLAPSGIIEFITDGKNLWVKFDR